ncbi:MAG: prolipoprotein diacylglyceryl transferase, partial [Verrucomicrobia bacterium]|nr:prolipoprotein diacylglyceryl transferase [Verrucomicrobiota bacterium]
LYVMAGVIVGGRFGYFLLYEPGDFFSNPLVLFAVWEGGMASHGGFAGVFLAVLLYARRNRLSPFAIGDLVVTVAPPGLFLGRIANFINGQLWGKVSEVSWAVVFPKSAPAGTPVELIPPRHPSQLYEAVLEGLVLFIYMQVRFWWTRGRHAAEGTRAAFIRPGQLVAEFLIAYSLLRCAGELYREPDATLLLGLSRGTFYSLLLLVFGVGMLVFLRRRPLTSGKS